jgi:pimeloyl-ACP methyl ester carboxylesterase
MQKVLANGLSLAYQRAGSGPALVLLHGFSLDSRSWRPQLEGLSDSFTVIAWDAPGAGESQDPPVSFGIGDWADALAAVLDAAGVRQAHVVGLSWGGLLAQEFYRRHRSRLRSLILVDTYAGWTGSLTAGIAEQRLQAALNDSTLAPGDFVQKYLPGMFSDKAADDILRELGAIMADFHPAGFRLMATALARADMREFLANINIPTLLIWGDSDKRAPLSVGQAMRDAIPGARLEVIRAAGHLTNVERPNEFNDIVRNFCLSVSARRAD